MSLTTRHMIDKATYWLWVDGASPTDPFADGYWQGPNVVNCEFEQGGKLQRDQDGQEFMPMTTVYTTVSVPRGARVIIGESEELKPTPEAEQVRKVNAGTSLRNQPKEYVWYTS